MALPFLPGNTFNRNLGKEKFHKSHYFEKRDDVGYQYGNFRPGIGGEKLPGQRIDAPTSVYPPGVGMQLPTWLAFDHQALCFDAYFQETVNERREEQYRVRRCKVLFYPEDDTIQVVEPRIANTGIPQGTIIRRHRISKPEPEGHLYYTVDDFNVGKNFTAYGKTFRLVACDQFTANFLRKLGVRLGEPESIPDDPYSVHRKAFAESMQPLRPYERMDKLRQFLDHDRHVLRFYCFWDDTDSMYGDPREMILQYYLADDTIDVHEVNPANSGRDGVPCFLRRQKLPRSATALPLPGTVTDRTLLNVFGHPQRGGRYILDSLKLGAVPDDFYTDRDLTLGASINVYGRKFLICDCDEFTKEYYRTKYGLEDFTPVKPPRVSTQMQIKRETPPYNGWGSEEDSLANCKGLIPVAPKGDFPKFVAMDKQGLESHILRFTARLLSKDPLDRDRLFMISCYLSDDTFSVYEPPKRNSGFKGGLFLERGRVKKPCNDRFPVELSDYYKPADIYIGALLEFNHFQFEITDADEYTLKYMEEHATEFSKADINPILDKLKPFVKGRCEELQQYAVNQDPEHTGTFGFRQLQCLIDQLTGPEHALVPHEMLTLGRHYAERPPKAIRHEILIGLAQQTLRKAAFEDYARMLQSCRQIDGDRTGEIDRDVLRRICLTHHVPIPNDMLNAIMEYSATQSGKIRYELFLSQLNWRCQTSSTPVVPCEYTGNLKIDWESTCKGDQPVSLGREFRPQAEIIGRVCYKPLFDDLCGTVSVCV
ncbi:EF-hand domain (C-terminal) containing 2 [Fasciola gigantica]|uniref:EF-hand domain-containing family member C2 n=1 Tax=Fasciola gigantica TaxID=46835 RepID=A0A504YHK6_FASGI|nr:EF-hand domain (C-terminal) containing 2 [Fasciola gigantica]